MSAHDAIDVRHNEPEQRFEVALGRHLARLDYERDGDVLRFYHTEVPREHEGKGIAAAMVRAALAYAEQADVKIQPACSYVRSYMRRHPETGRLLAPYVTL